MKSVSKNEFNLPDGHKKIKTRRDFLAHTAGAFSAGVLAPSLWSLLFSNAAKAMGQKQIPMLTFDLAGGAGLPGNFLVGRQTGTGIDLLSSYSRLGWNPTDSGAIDNRFGLPMAAKASKIFEQIVARSSKEAQANFRMGSFCHRSQDDVVTNPLSIAHLVNISTSSGLYLKSAIGLRDSNSGGNSISLDASPDDKALAVTSLNDLVDSIGSGRTFNGLPSNFGQEVAKGILGLTTSQLNDLKRYENGARLSEIAKASYASLGDAADMRKLDPRQNAAVAKIYGLNQNTEVNNPDVVKSTIVMNTILGLAGPGIITIGGCDYHLNNAQASDGIDTTIGTEIGRALETAYQLKQPLFIHIITDGGVGAPEGSRAWGSDDGTKSMSVIGYFDPEKAPAQRRLQVGEYTNGQGVNLNTLIGAGPVEAAYAAFANYLSISGRVGEFQKLAPKSSMASHIDEVLIF